MKKLWLILVVIFLVACQSSEPTIMDASDMINVSLSDHDPSDNEEETDSPSYERSDQGLEDLEFIGTLSNGDRIYYKPGGKYFSRLIASSIVAEGGQGPVVLSDSDSSIPVIAPDASRVAFVKNIGFERQGQLYVYDGDLNMTTSDQLTDKLSDHRTLKDCEWYDSDKLLVILGYDSGTITQGGDVYFLTVDNGELRMVLDAKEGREIVNISYEDDILFYDVVTWLDANYLYYDYSRDMVILSDHLNQLPVKIAWQPFNMEATYLDIEEVLSATWFRWPSSQDVGYHRRVEEEAVFYENDSFTYQLDASENHVTKIIIRDYNGPLIREVHMGDDLMDVLDKFPNESHYLKTVGGVFYKSHDGEQIGSLIQNNQGFELSLLAQGWRLTFSFDMDVLKSVTLEEE